MLKIVQVFAVNIQYGFVCAGPHAARIRPMTDVSFVIATRFGGSTLKRCLETVTDEMRHSRATSEIVLIADGCQESDLGNPAEITSNIRIFRHAKPLGVARAYNRGFAEARGRFAVCLNDDMFLQPNFLDAALDTLDDDRVFSVTPHMIQADTGDVCNGRNAMRWSDHHLDIVSHRNADTPYAFFSTGGGIFRRDLWQTLGGFSDLFRPFYWEDVHLSYQAWTRGFEIRYAPQCKVLHAHRATTSRIVTPLELARVMARNSWLFAWANLTSPAFTRRIVRGGLESARALGSDDRSFFLGFISAHARLGNALALRRKTTTRRTVSDEAIWEKVGLW